MVEQAGKDAAYRFESGSLDLGTTTRLAADMWSDLAFDETALARLRRDGLVLDGVRLTGPSPYQLAEDEDGGLVVSVADHPDAAVLMDLWRIHFVRGLRSGSLAA